MAYRLVIIDDEKEISSGFAKFFPWGHLGFTVEGQFQNAYDTLEFLKTNVVDVIVSDVLMPGMTGIELAKEISQMKINKPKIIFFSAYDKFVYAQEAIKYGASQYILKSTSYDELIEVFTKLKEELDEDANTQKSDTPLSEEDDKILGIIKDYIAKHMDDVNLDVLAEKVYMSPPYVSRYFKAKTGINFRDYLIEMRMKKAEALLEDLQYNIGEISMMVGYTNPFNFTRMFKKMNGVTPKDYRVEKLGKSRIDDNGWEEL
jgi:YesN/AraC family two-component response regulator